MRRPLDILDRQWWDGLSPQEQRNYLQLRPKSRYRKARLKPFPKEVLEKRNTPIQELKDEERESEIQRRKVHTLKRARNAIRKETQPVTRQHIDDQINELQEKRTMIRQVAAYKSDYMGFRDVLSVLDVVDDTLVRSITADEEKALTSKGLVLYAPTQKPGMGRVIYVLPGEWHNRADSITEENLQVSALATLYALDRVRGSTPEWVCRVYEGYESEATVLAEAESQNDDVADYLADYFKDYQVRSVENSKSKNNLFCYTVTSLLPIPADKWHETERARFDINEPSRKVHPGMNDLYLAEIQLISIRGVK